MPAQPSHEPPQRAGGRADDTGPAERRADARRNRARILQAAQEAFADKGIDVPLTAVARRAGVGAATLYRHFPTRAALVSAAFAEQLSVCVAALDEALDDPDPLRGLRNLLEQVCAMQATDRGFAAAFMEHFPDALDYDQESARAEDGLALLIERGQRTGQLRADVAPADVTLLLLANRGLAGQPEDTALAASSRLLAHFLRSAQTRYTSPMPPPPHLGLHKVHPHL
ncbi:TetR/AcrR family transcriptional regulator [Streptomyces sp. NPDC102340]|uniref:TetR/AcrR family transcriptional regulator n=1 Tax=unclassified Streptomyces TaxID=2593676 RepID=UPI003829C9AE